MHSLVSMTKDYTNNSLAQRTTTYYVNLLLEKAITEMNEKFPKRLADSSIPVNIADLGCSTGCNSLDTLETCISAIRQINPDMPINIYLEDTPANDFNITARLVQEGLRKKDIKDIYIYCVSKSFYERLFPANSMDNIFSMTAVLWIRESPCVHENLIFCYDSKTENDELQKSGEQVPKETGLLF